MRIATYEHEGRQQVGAVSADGTTFRPFALNRSESALGALPLVQRCAALMAQGKNFEWPSFAGAPVAIASVRLRAPIPQPRRNIFCVGRNYHAHAKELRDSVFKANSADPQAWPIVFTKVPETVIGPNDVVQMPLAVSSHIDYEAELTVVIGVGGRNISREDAMKHVWGYTIINDVTARDVQMRHQQWDLGKSFDTFCPMGPWLVTADELDCANTQVRLWVNGELRQDANTSDFIFDVPTLIETCSRGITLLPGDLIATGTPAGVGMGFTPPRYLQPGDEVRIAIDGIGELKNSFAAEKV